LSREGAASAFNFNQMGSEQSGTAIVSRRLVHDGDNEKGDEI
jgi:hypothetical protein